METGFVLITTEPGSEHYVKNMLESVFQVTNLWLLFGEYDLIVKIEADTQHLLTRTIVEEIRPITGITDTKTLLSANI